MSILTSALYDVLANDATLTALLGIYKGNPAIFTSDPAPGDVTPPYIVTAGEPVQTAWDTKTTRGRSLMRDVRCYTVANGSTVEIEAISERVRELLHRQPLTISGYTWVISDVGGPLVADERDYYGRILSLSLKAEVTPPTPPPPSPADILQELLLQFSGAGDVVAFHNSVNFAGTRTWEVYQRLHGNTYWRIKYETTPAVGSSYLRIGSIDFRSYYRAITRDTAPQMNWSAAWTSSDSESYVGGKTYFINAVNAWMEFTSEAGASEVGVIASPGGGNLGIALVTVDGSPTAANQLATAQELVNSGSLAATALVANGGTLNPTDRVIDFYNLPAVPLQGTVSAHPVLVATGLTGSHTVRVKVTGYKNVASSGTYANMHGFYEQAPDFTPLYPIATVAHMWVKLVDMFFLAGGPPVWEVSWSVIPTGAVNSQWVGHSSPMTLKVKVAPSVEIDGVAFVPSTVARTEVTTIGTSSVAITQQCSVVHPEIGAGATEIGVWDATYTMDAVIGYTIAHSLDWSLGGQGSGYPCMMTLSYPTYDRVKALDSVAVALGDDDNSNKATTQLGAMLAWDHDGNQAALMHIPDLALTVNNWADSTNFLYMLDWDGGGGAVTWKKIYANRFTAFHAYTPADVWSALTNYRAGYFPDGAENNLQE